MWYNTIVSRRVFHDLLLLDYQSTNYARRPRQLIVQAAGVFCVHTQKTPPPWYASVRGAAGSPIMLKQIAMSPRASEVKNQLVAVDLIDQKPIRGNVAFPAAALITHKLVVMILGRELFSGSQLFDDRSEKRQVIAAFLDALEVFLEAGGGANGVHHASRSSIIWSTSV